MSQFSFLSRPWPHFVLGAASALFLGLALPATSLAAVSNFGSTLSTPASADTASNLNYAGTDIPTISNNRPVVVHVNHDGADTAVWNVTLPDASPTAPAAGQILSVRLEGCAQPANGGAAPLTQFHFQDLAPQPGGGAKVNVTTQPFDIPICGQSMPDGSAASGRTVSTFTPTNFCVNQGDYVGFNDEGGFDPNAYPSGVPYRVLAPRAGTRADSFVRNNGTGNGAVFSPSDTSNHDGYATNQNTELMLQAQLGTGADATPLCPGGTKGVPAPRAPTPQAGQPGGPPALILHAQNAGVNHRRWVALTLYCAQVAGGCHGSVTVFTSGGAARVTKLGIGTLSSSPGRTAHVRMRLTPAALILIRHHHRSLPVTMVVTLPGGTTFTQQIHLKI